MSIETPVDVAVVGAGLASAILALRLARLPRPPRLLILERGPAAFAERTWSFQALDVAPDDLEWLAPAIAHRWPRQSVVFRGHARTLASPYASLTAASVARAVSALPGVAVRVGAEATRLDPDAVTLADGTRIAAGCVIDARGHAPDPALTLRYQKFVGLDVETAAPHGVTAPVIMDAAVEQIDGFRFVYLLPFGPTRLLIEDTRYADGPHLDAVAIEATIAAYAQARGWTFAAVRGREAGVLPIALAFDARAFWAAATDVPRIGMRAALFHAATGYSLPDAVRAANLVAGLWPASSAALARAIRRHALARERRQRFYMFLNRMLFIAARPEDRHRVLEKFYRLPLPLIERFYAGRTTTADVLRILSGKPPVPVSRALACLGQGSALRAAGA